MLDFERGMSVVCKAFEGPSAGGERADMVVLCDVRESESFQGGEKGRGVDEVLMNKTDNNMVVEARMCAKDSYEVSCEGFL